jgi:CheY-like chemotaxis protein
LGFEAVEAVRSRPYDVVLMDVEMPELDGLEATRRIRVERRGDRAPRIVAVTANAMQGDRDACLAAGMDDYLTKPIRLEALDAALRRCRPRGTDVLDHEALERPPGDAAATGQILISQRVFAEVEDVVEAEPAGEVELKGFHGAQRVFKLIALKAPGETAEPVPL